MAVDPATAAKVAGILYKNRDAIANKLFAAVMSICILLTFFSSFLTYILAAPMEELGEYFSSPMERAALALLRREYGYLIAPGYDGTFDTSFHGDYPFPVPVYRISCEYGPRINPVDGTSEFHTGLDIVTDWHGPIKAIDDGIVAAMEINKYYGRYVMLRHERMVITGYEEDPETGEKMPIKEKEVFYSFYAHLASFNVVCTGQEIRKGENIGAVGGDPNRDSFPGYSTGAHLHFGIYDGLNPYRDHIDPHPYMTD